MDMPSMAMTTSLDALGSSQSKLGIQTGWLIGAILLVPYAQQWFIV